MKYTAPSVSIELLSTEDVVMASFEVKDTGVMEEIDWADL